LIGPYVPRVWPYWYTNDQANREDLEAANLVLSWWSDSTGLGSGGETSRHRPPLHTDPVYPNDSIIKSNLPTNPTTTSSSKPPARSTRGHTAVNAIDLDDKADSPLNLAAVDDWKPHHEVGQVDAGPEGQDPSSVVSTSSISPSVSGSGSHHGPGSQSGLGSSGSGSGEARRITLKVHRG
jgi:hypothetical protein